MELELSTMFSFELDSVELLELATSELDETGISPELLSSGSPQPSGGQDTPYRGWAVFSLVQLAQKKAVSASAIFFQFL